MHIRCDNTWMTGGTGFCTRSVPVLFCSVPFCSVLFCSALFRSALFCSVPFCSVPFCSVLFWLAPGLKTSAAFDWRRTRTSGSNRMLASGRLWTFWLIIVVSHASFNALVHPFDQGLSSPFGIAFADMPVQQRVTHQGFIAARALPVASENDSGWTILGFVAHWLVWRNSCRYNTSIVAMLLCGCPFLLNKILISSCDLNAPAC